jgi:hypothetical protein
VATDNNKAMGYQNKSVRDVVDVTINDDKIAITDQKVAVLTLGGKTGAWTFLASDNGKYLALTSGSNAIHASDDATADESLWKITEDFQLNSINFSTRYIQYNSGSPRFACYESTQQDAVLFVKAGSDVSTTVSIASACTDGKKYYGTYSNDKAFRVPADLTVSAVGITDGKLVVKNYNEGEIVKSNTGVMISSSTAGTHTLILTESEGTEKDGNCLKASGDEDINAAAMETAAPDCNYYRLTMHNGKHIGFWWGEEEGAAFSIAANKAYLAVPKPKGETPARGLWFEEGETTAISEVRGLKSDVRGEYFNLNGQRVAQPTKGLYIVNGRKVVIK